jgi:hypothetical protein
MPIGKFQPQNNFFHYGTSIDTLWLARPDYLKRQKNNIVLIYRITECVAFRPERLFAPTCPVEVS